MNCKRCHHVAQIHEESQKSSSLMKLGKCAIPECMCRQFVESIDQLDEDLM
ncbi:hypothetical protein [Candidatus Nitrosotenuis cloacae]|uniref:hypothetical protein n=1 Tax=Candidatus Nitrosotenuis cloacae TaxID=1603555 RepID=UPI0015A5E7A1|nr:hypothetical protein [Candidatus Nitrosotenuis cloacae]